MKAEAGMVAKPPEVISRLRHRPAFASSGECLDCGTPPVGPALFLSEPDQAPTSCVTLPQTKMPSGGFVEQGRNMNEKNLAGVFRVATKDSSFHLSPGVYGHKN